MYNFTTPTDDVSYWPVDRLWDLDSAKATIKWSCEFEMREWGVKGITTIVDSVQVTGMLIHEETEEEKEYDVTFRPDSEYKIEIYFSEFEGQISPIGVNIDEVRKIIIVDF